jgi:hypothetical protein
VDKLQGIIHSRLQNKEQLEDPCKEWNRQEEIILKSAKIAIPKSTTGPKKFPTIKTKLDQLIRTLCAIHRQKSNANSLSAQLLEEINLLLALNLLSANSNGLNADQGPSNYVLTDHFSLIDARKALARLACLKSQHISKERLEAHRLKQAEYDNNHLLNTPSMINSALNRNKNSISLDYAIENFGDESTETLHNKPQKVLQEVASQAAKLFEHNDAPFDINDEWAEFFAPVENADLDMISVADPFTLKEIEHGLRICGQE